MIESLPYRAYTVSEKDGHISSEIKSTTTSDLPFDDVLIKVEYSSLNYKDALSAKGHKGITRQYPHVPGIDAAGEIVESSKTEYPEGMKVIVTGFDLGMNTFGGFGEYIRVPSSWIVPLPATLSLEEAMALGTAGFTAALALFKMKQAGLQRKPGNSLLVTGATGGVGTLAVAMLTTLGFNVSAVTGKTKHHDFLIDLGAVRVMDRDVFESRSSKPLLPSYFDGCIETTGGVILENVIKKMNKEAPVAVCGNVAGSSFKSTVYPLILRGVSLLGIDSAHIENPIRSQIWDLLATDWKPSQLSSLYRVIELEQLSEEIETILKGNQIGRVVLKHSHSPL